ncbi:uncharacterized protein LOC132168181 isoform X1 [Corylus avellana]|uniref:uncharacterized protein LOC132167896 isoform X1 n=1 Tax=Corylus avellana TaxID=13451 RepID=UPI00286ADC56|nr:uncharacterized protein LOC132167896 isoform X1 [Corylus avellana]XP_059434917.1 uncharacterized protein LOC132167896 isoform X1 [Corylus avellana]XP_059435280.1 uncharacterized protein LOC132168181 isoform X1 [Corylus avellana]XP_059435281.1 uncharacterized protein LOC132168181 isoform X1 [Corylus avellana]
MSGKGQVLPDCPNSSNPYHECTQSCLKKISQGQTSKDKKKSGSVILDVSRSFGRRKKESSRPNSPQVHDKLPSPNAVYPSGFASKKKVEVENGEDFPHFDAKETFAQYPFLNKGPVQSSQSVPTSGILTLPDNSRDTPKINGGLFYGETTNSRVEDEKLHASQNGVPKPLLDDMGEHGGGASATESMNFTFTGITNPLEGSDDEEIQSVISDSCVSVGRYHVKESLASILQSIFDKYGDIAASCQLESLSLRSYYLECVCTVVKELQSSSAIHLTKPKIKELSAILKDVESAKIDVSWLRGIINDMTKDVELISQHRAIESAKSNCDSELEAKRKELASQMEDLSLKEKEAAIAKKQVAKTRARLSELELKASQLNETILSIRSKVENFQGRSLLDELL